MRDEMQAALRRAAKDRDKRTVAALRIGLAALSNAEAVDASAVAPGTTEVARRNLSSDEARAVLRSEADDLRASAEELVAHGRTPEADELFAKVVVLERYC